MGWGLGSEVVAEGLPVLFLGDSGFWGLGSGQ